MSIKQYNFTGSTDYSSLTPEQIKLEFDETYIILILKPKLTKSNLDFDTIHPSTVCYTSFSTVDLIDHYLETWTPSPIHNKSILTMTTTMQKFKCAFQGSIKLELFPTNIKSMIYSCPDTVTFSLDLDEILIILTDGNVSMTTSKLNSIVKIENISK